MTGWKGQAHKLGNLRSRAKREIAALQRQIDKMADTEKHGRMGQSTQRQIETIMEAAEGTYLGRKPSKEKRYEAEQSANILLTLIGKTGKRGRAAQQERQNRIFYQQMREDTTSGDSAFFGGVAGKLQYEKIFYISTRDIWEGKGIKADERNNAIMKSLGVKSLEDAYRIVLSHNTDVIEEIIDMVENGEIDGDVFEEITSDELAALMEGRGAQILQDRMEEMN